MNLTKKQIRFVRSRYAKGGISQRALAELVGVSETYLHAILVGRVGQDAGGPLHAPTRGVFSKKDVVAIRRNYASRRVTQLELAQEHGVDVATISRLVRGETYAEVGGPVIDGAAARPRSSRLSPEQVDAVLTSAEGHSALAKRYGVSRQLVQQLRERWGWKG
jgi:DNA-binding XRE family transcriptional regulator